MLSPHLHCAEITSSWTEWRFCPVSVTCARWTHTLIAPVYLCNTPCHTIWKFRKRGKLSRSTLHNRELRGKLHDWNLSQNRSSGNPACAVASTLDHSRHLRVYSWRCPTEPVGGGESAPSPLKPAKKRSAARAAEAKSYRHTLCALGAWLCHLAWSCRTQAAELAGVTDSFKGLFILVSISKE